MTNPRKTPNGQDNPARLLDLFRQMAEITSEIQLEMTHSLLKHKSVSEDLEKQLKTSENAMKHRVDKAVYTFVAAMPLATANRQNLFMEALGFQAKLTGNTLIHDLLHEVNRQTLSEDSD